MQRLGNAGLGEFIISAVRLVVSNLVAIRGTTLSMNRLNRFLWQALLGLYLNLSALPALAEEMAVIQESKPLVTRAGAWQTWGDHLHLRRGQERLPLRLTFINGADGRPKATDLKVFLGRDSLATFKDYKNDDSFSVDLSGKLHSGNNSLKVQGFGPSGARMRWKFLIQRPSVISVSPDPVGASDTMTINGKNFSDQTEYIKVHVGNKYAKPISSTPDKIKVKLPNHSPPGPQPVTVSVNYVHSEPRSVSVRSNPRITRVSMLASPPSEPVTITGSGFSTDVNDNIVTVGGRKAQITNATANSITFIVPNMPFPKWHVPIQVTTKGMPSKDKAHINVDVRVVPNEGIPMQ